MQDSEHAADLDSLVFESEEVGGGQEEEEGVTVAGIMNEPRLGVIVINKDGVGRR